MLLPPGDHTLCEASSLCTLYIILPAMKNTGLSYAQLYANETFPVIEEELSGKF